MPVLSRLVPFGPASRDESRALMKEEQELVVEETYQAGPRRFVLFLVLLGLLGLAAVALRYVGQDSHLAGPGDGIVEKVSTPLLPMADMFCFTVMGLPTTEQPLLTGQKEKSKGLFACPSFAVFGTVKIPPVTKVIPGLQTQVAYGGKWKTAMNTQVFAQVWKEVQQMPEVAAHAWTVKLDADTVFLPHRLGPLLPASPPSSYLQNCNEGLHGPIEVISREALKAIQWDVCGAIAYEDFWLESCLRRAGASAIPAWPKLLHEKGCRPRLSGPCGSSSVAFHPKKSPSEWWSCLAEAEAFPIPGWVDHTNINCVPGQGAQALSGQPEPFHSSMHPLDCLKACEDIPDCQAVVVLESYDPSPCFLRTQVDLGSCFPAPGFSLWAKPGTVTTITTTTTTTLPTTTATTSVQASTTTKTLDARNTTMNRTAPNATPARSIRKPAKGPEARNATVNSTEPTATRAKINGKRAIGQETRNATLNHTVANTTVSTSPGKPAKAPNTTEHTRRATTTPTLAATVTTALANHSKPSTSQKPATVSETTVTTQTSTTLETTTITTSPAADPLPELPAVATRRLDEAPRGFLH
ncbi:C42C1.13 [Symbiodinium microadriaticum]|nr:C42C1.13 [Symbiodinium microadriaticum]